MFEEYTASEERGQVGIGTLIVFIALVLVAAIAAGVLINTAGFLQTQAQSTGEESTEQVSTNLVFLSSTGTVTEDGSGDPAGVKSFNTTVQLGPGSSSINLNDSTISVFTDSGDSVEFDGVDESGIDLQGSEVLSTDSSDEDATATLEFDIDSAGIGEDLDGDTSNSNGLAAGTTVDVVITTPSGTQAETSFII
ncbi:archaellin/type IV pilin N-terminal domain-containing protein, partial [Natronomonas sp.]|uniref:archaellin/type IV pilin N-terminal domain-containing protein n=1 Tax=Natronomonas sp. TaxID=2184060 RepID=UPI0026236C32